MATVTENPEPVHSNQLTGVLHLDGDDAWWAAVSAELDQEQPHVFEPEAEPSSFPHWIQEQASYFRSLDTSSGRFLAGELDELAQLAAELKAMTAEAFAHRRHERRMIDREGVRLDGFRDGYDKCHRDHVRGHRCPPPPHVLHGGHEFPEMF